MAKKKILIVDDDDDVRFSIADGLEAIDNNLHITQAENGEKALKILQKEYFDLIILDIMMPIMDGFTVSAKIKENPNLATIPTIFLSAKTDEYSRALGKMSAVDYIEKPFEILDLKQRIDKALDN